MSAMRWPVYVWDSSSHTHLWPRRDADPKECHPDETADVETYSAGISIRSDIFDALVLYRHAELAVQPEEMKKARKAAKRLRGNVGSYAWSDQEGIRRARKVTP